MVPMRLDSMVVHSQTEIVRVCYYFFVMAVWFFAVSLRLILSYYFL